MQVAPAYGELPVARDEEEIAPEISRASELLDDVGVCESASSSPHWPRKAIHEGTVLSDSVHDITDQNSAATSAIVVISTDQASVVLAKAQAFELPLAAKAEWSRRWVTGSLLACFLLIALAGSMPRSIALVIISRTVQVQSPMSAVLENFTAIWAPCKDPENAFTAIYRDGQLYRSIILTDHAFWLMGVTMAYLGAIHVVFPVMRLRGTGCRRAPSLFSLSRSALCVLGVVNFAMFMGMDLALYHPKMTRDNVQASHLLLDYFLYSASSLFLLSYVILSASNPARLPGVNWRRRLIFSTLIVLLMGLGLFFLLWIGNSSQMNWSLHSLLNFTGRGAAVGKILCIVATSRVLLLLLRGVAVWFADLTDNTTCQVTNIFTFIVTFSISMSIRLNASIAVHHSPLYGAPGLDGADRNLVRDMYNTALISLLLCVGELVAYLAFTIFLILEGNHCYRHIHASTLVESLISHARFAKKRQIFYGSLWCDELAEFCACVTIAIQELPRLLFSQPFFEVATLSDFEQYDDRHVMARFAVRLLIQVLAAGTIMHVSQAIFPMDVKTILRRFISRPSLIFFIGFVISHPVSFVVYGQTCEQNPLLTLMSLTYTECLRRSVVLQGQYVCNRPREGVSFTRPLVRELLNQTGVSPVDLGYKDFAEVMTEVDAARSILPAAGLGCWYPKGDCFLNEWGEFIS